MIRKAITSVLFFVLALPAFATADIEEVISPGGIRAWLVEDHTIPFVALDIRFNGGTSLDDPDRRGAIYLMSGLLEEGAGQLDAGGYAEAVEALAADFGFNSYRDSVGITAQMLTANRQEATELLRLALVEPRFDENAIERVRSQVISIIDSNAQDPNEIAGATFASMAYGDHPYAMPEEGTLDGVAALSRDDLLAAHRAVFARDRVFIGAAGDITPEELGQLLDDLLGELPAEGGAFPQNVSYELEGGLTVVDYPTPQSVVLFGQPGLERLDPDFFPAFVLNQIVGGGNFQSRLMDQVRVERGLTYGINTYLSLAEYQPMFIGQLSSSNELVTEAIDVIREQLIDIEQNGVTEQELEDAIRYMTGAYPLRFDGNSTIASIMAGMQSDGMPIDYIATRNAQVEAVTLEDVHRVAQRLLRPETLHFVVVGQPEGLDASN